MEITLNSTDRLVQNHKSIFKKEEDGAFLFDSDTENMKYINKMGVNNPILQKLRREIPRNLEGICSRCIFKFRCRGHAGNAHTH